MGLTRAKAGVWCDTCKARWGTVQNVGGTRWHTNAEKAAIVTVHSVNPNSNKTIRSYCNACLNDVQEWQDGTIWKLEDQTNYLHGAEQLPNV